MRGLNDILVNGEGYMVLENFIPESLIIEYRAKLKDLYPVRASSRDKMYAENQGIGHLPDIAVWWSQLVNDMPEAIAIRGYIDRLLAPEHSHLKFYASDTVTIAAGSQWISPHVDTPHRFHPWSHDKRLLGIQCIVSLFDTDKNNGSTGLVPYSQKRNFEIFKCYSGNYTSWFMRNYTQPVMPCGSLLLYNCRVLHSSMPNNTDRDRPALLFNYLDESITEEVRQVDNVWFSNGKHS